ncbi:alpha/beta-hydrolase, partial [Backusella circina FSU 941]
IIVSYLYWRYWKMGSGRFKKSVRVDIQYSNESTNCKLDVYLPNKKITSAPIIVFIYGGSWSSGSKLMYTTCANTLRDLGYVVVVPDYRKYPEGHSAGAHLATQVVLSDVIEKVKYQENLMSGGSSPQMGIKHDPAEIKLGNEELTCKIQDFLPQVEGLLLFSGVYDIQSHLIHETNRGVEEISAMARAMGSCDEGYKINSPIFLMKENASLLGKSEELLDLWPRVLIVHGQKDTTVGMEQSSNMFNTIGKLLPVEHRKEVDVRMRLHKRMGHGEPVIDLMYNPFANKTLQKLLLRDIQEFIDLPLSEDKIN